MDPILGMRIIIENPVTAVAYGLQKGTGHHYETLQVQQSNENDLLFDFTIKIMVKNKIQPGFGGPFVHGPATEKFIYIDIGKSAGQINSEWQRRLKIPLRGITNEIIEEVIKRPDCVLLTKVPGKGKDDSPNCATVKPFGGWQLLTVPDWKP